MDEDTIGICHFGKDDFLRRRILDELWKKNSVAYCKIFNLAKANKYTIMLFWSFAEKPWFQLKWAKNQNYLFLIILGTDLPIAKDEEDEEFFLAKRSLLNLKPTIVQVLELVLLDIIIVHHICLVSGWNTIKNLGQE